MCSFLAHFILNHAVTRICRPLVHSTNGHLNIQQTPVFLAVRAAASFVIALRVCDLCVRFVSLTSNHAMTRHYRPLTLVLPVVCACVYTCESILWHDKSCSSTPSDKYPSVKHFWIDLCGSSQVVPGAEATARDPIGGIRPEKPEQYLKGREEASRRWVERPWVK